MNRQKGIAPILIVLLIALTVGGYLLYQNQSKPAPVQQATQPTPTPDETASWKTYKNDQFNFELRLPEDVQIKENQAGSNTIRFSNVYKWEDKEIDPDTKQYLDIFLFVSIVDPQIDLKDWILKDATRPMPNGKIESQIKGEIQKYKQGFVDGYWYVGIVEEEDKYIVFKKDNKIFKFRLNGYQTGSSYKDNPNAETILDQIISTFRFLDPSSITNVCAAKKTYRSLEKALEEPNKVCYLDLSSKNLTKLPEEVLQFNNLQSLYLNFNKLTTLPEDIKKLKNLTSIDLTGNPITIEETNRLRSLLPKINILNIQQMNLPQ